MGPRVAVPLAVLTLGSCGDQWTPGHPPHTETFPLECVHADSTCESCHPADQPLGRLETDCISCHLEVRPVDHDPASTRACDDCHVGSCGWDSAENPHPEGFSASELHGLEAVFQGPTEGDCRSCHGADLTGGTSTLGGSASGCDDCHADNGHPDWRTDCVYCHGGTEDPTGAPPRDLDGGTDLAALSFGAHPAHVQASPDYRTVACTECHPDHVEALDQGHWWDPTPGVSEVVFGGFAQNTTWDAASRSCSDDYCHGSGSRADGVVADDGASMTCDSCHPTTTGWEGMSGLHLAHLGRDPTITCNDCHGAVIDADGQIATASRHVDGARDVSLTEPAIVYDGLTCTGSCHDTPHDTFGWGHVEDYERPELHGVDSNLGILDCGACHGADWTGGMAQGCDDCHATEGRPDWRTDCTFCHGGDGGDTTGAPPQDIDDQSEVALLTFQAHRAHVGTSPIGHASYDCTQCHAAPTTALDPGHAVDATQGLAEVSLLNGTSPEGGYYAASRSCSDLYCHGNGQAPSGTIVDGTTALDCDSCHAYSVGHDAMSGTHAEHLAVAGVTCADCHAPVVDAAGDVVTPELHVDRSVDLDLGASGFSPIEGACTTTCHGVSHDRLGWSGNHPDGFDDPLLHGQEALLRLQSCAGSACHGADLRGPADGAPGQSCDECHAVGWRADCTYCHGGADGDLTGAPPEDVDNTIDEAAISFGAHPEHQSHRIAPEYACSTCHAAADGYVDAVTDGGHWLLDATRTVAEVQFGGIASGATYAAGSCSNNYCHGDGQVPGSAIDGAVPLTCNGCHKYDQGLTQLSGTHSLHLAVTGVTCADCHGGVVSATGTVTDPDRHVDGAVQLDGSAGWDAATESCANSCHGHTHAGQPWAGGHRLGYDQPTVHGQEALFRQLDCATSGCHGDDLLGGASGQGCDSCHTPGWREDCIFCHGGENGDVSGVPPQDIDNVTADDQITFLAHPEHHAGDHPGYACSQCHGALASNYTDAFADPGHWWQSDATFGRAEVTFADGLSPAGAYNPSTGTCSGLYCHGDGVTDSGSVTDSIVPLGCGDCHADRANPASLSGTHADHLAVVGVTCADCHAPVVDIADVVVTPALHVQGAVDVDLATTGWDPASATCTNTCHVSHDGIGWAGYHPPGYDDPLAHGQDALFRFDGCADCHGLDLRGGTGPSCDDCHVTGWRSDCTYCHGGAAGDTRGAPPEDLDNVASEASISFKAHPEHADADIHPLYACDTCHNGTLAYTDAVTDPGHWLVSDASPGAPEVKFAGIAAGGAYSAGTCSNNYCHGDGVTNGAVSDGTTALTCNGCHAYDQSTELLSGTHDLHLGVTGVSCADCHPDVSATGAVTNPAKHVNKLVDLDQAGTGWIASSETCTVTCHNHVHTARAWVGGHPAGYDAPEVHGQEALFKLQDCATSGCHGTDLGGGSSGVSCDSCHVSGWRQDCTYCHGGQLGDTDGLPPEDLDNVTSEDAITFLAHPEHHDGDDHSALGCDQCHGAASLDYADAFTDPGHWWTAELTPGTAEIDFTDGLSPAATYNAVTGTCSGLYCHGDGVTSAGLVSDSALGLACDDCHADVTNPSALSGSHGAHLGVAGVTCSDCHGPVVNATNVVTTPALHVDGGVHLDLATTGWDAAGSTCVNSCHGVAHNDIGWTGYHPPGYDDALAHGQDALFRLDGCTDCHGADLRGGTGPSCDDCHVTGWRSDCTYCHGGAAGDTRGAPPEDLDNVTNEASISFKAHPEHADSDIHPLYACDTCHNGALSYLDAVTDLGHWLVNDATAGVPEVKFAGIAGGGAYSAGTCSNNYCHGDGVTNGTISDGTTALTCNGCHAYDQSTELLSGTHDLHLDVTGVSCADCHSDVSATGAVTNPTKHVNKLVDLDLVQTGWVATSESCTITCHSHTHTARPWIGGHPAGYDAPEVHGQEALFKIQDCASSGCHGTDLGGGSSGVSCDDCHVSGWRQDCTYCHGGQLGDADGLPPEDLDNVTDEGLISFMAHPEHHDNTDHPVYGCDECHGAASLTYTDAFTDPGHWWTDELTPGLADVDLTDGLSPAGTYNATTSTCSNLYCHGDGNGTLDAQADSANALTCNSCHADTTNALNSGDHDNHEDEACSECHVTVVDAGMDIIGDDLHVNGSKQAAAAAGTGITITKSGTTITCSGGQCHGQDHSHTNDRW